MAGRIAEAFIVLEVTSWLVPDASKREAVLAGDFEILVGHAMRHGMVHATADRTSVAVWLPSVGEPAPPPADYDARLAAACGEWTDGSSTSTSCSRRTIRIRTTTTWRSWRPGPISRGRGWGAR